MERVGKVRYWMFYIMSSFLRIGFENLGQSVVAQIGDALTMSNYLCMLVLLVSSSDVVKTHFEVGAKYHLTNHIILFILD